MNIVLTGFMGSGKSSVGKLLAAKINYDFIETDEIIESIEKRSINDIFKDSGEAYFRDKESSVALEVSKKERVVISTGGGVVLREYNVDALRKNGKIIYLSASPETILERVKAQTHRPLLNTDDMLLKIKSLLKKRESYYENCDLLIDVNSKTLEQIVDEIIGILKGLL